FSSRRRHTRSDRDWSSNVCSSDLSTTLLYGVTTEMPGHRGAVAFLRAHTPVARTATFLIYDFTRAAGATTPAPPAPERPPPPARSEERRVGKECRSLRWPSQTKED